MTCECGAPETCAPPERVEFSRPGDYVVAPGVARRVEVEVRYNLAHPKALALVAEVEAAAS